MAVDPVKNYLNGVVTYYGLDPRPQQRILQPQHVLPPHPSSFYFMPRLALGGNTRPRDPNINIVGGSKILNEVRDNQRQDQKEDRATSAAWLGGILTIIGAAGLACVVNGRSKIGERLEAAREFKNIQLPTIQNQQQKTQLTEIVNKDIYILEKKQFAVRNISILTGLAVASAGTAFAAGMFAVQWLITTAIVVGVATLALGTFAAVYYALETSETPKGVIEYLQNLEQAAH